MKSKILGIVATISVVYSAISIGYTALPTEIQAMIPFYSEAVAWITGSSSGIVGATLLYVKSAIDKNNTANDEKVNLAVTKLIDVINQVIEIKGDLESNYSSVKSEVTSAINELKSVKKLIQADLELKLSNKLVNQEAKELAEKVLKDEV